MERRAAARRPKEGLLELLAILGTTLLAVDLIWYLLCVRTIQI
jgi:hypothetical protein